jgi:ATP-dependent DNA helicase RecG
VIEVPQSRDCEYTVVYTPYCLKTVSAFANYLDGRLIFGIKDDRTVLGVENVQQLMLQIEHAINDGISPRPSYKLYTCRREGRQLVVLSVCKGMNPPYYYQHRAYVRFDASTAPVDAAQLRQLVLQGSALAYEELPASKQDLSFKQLEAEFQKVLGIETLSNDLLKTLGLVDRQGYTYAGQLLSDSPGPFHASLDIARFGESSSIFLHRESLEECSVLYQYHRVLELLDAWYGQYEQVSGFYREKRIQIPREACREVCRQAFLLLNILAAEFQFREM